MVSNEMSRRREENGEFVVGKDGIGYYPPDALTPYKGNARTHDDRKRPIEDIPEEEIILAAKDLRFDDDVPRALAVAFGFSRLRAPSRERIEAALQTAEDINGSLSIEELEPEIATAQFTILPRVTETRHSELPASPKRQPFLGQPD